MLIVDEKHCVGLIATCPRYDSEHVRQDSSSPCCLASWDRVLILIDGRFDPLDILFVRLLLQAFHALTKQKRPASTSTYTVMLPHEKCRFFCQLAQRRVPNRVEPLQLHFLT